MEQQAEPEPSSPGSTPSPAESTPQPAPTSTPSPTPQVLEQQARSTTESTTAAASSSTSGSSSGTCSSYSLTVNQWEACGGSEPPPGSPGPSGSDAQWACCSLGNKCVRQNSAYWQCRQDLSATADGYVSALSSAANINTEAEVLAAKYFGDATVSGSSMAISCCTADSLVQICALSACSVPYCHSLQ